MSMNAQESKLFTLPSSLARAIAARRRPKVRRCAVCGQEFTTVGRGLYCSKRCGWRAGAARRRARKRALESAPPGVASPRDRDPS